MSKPFDFNSLHAEFYPLPFEKYFLIIIDSEDSRYLLWDEVIRLIRPDLKSKGIEIVVVDNTGKFKSNCLIVRDASWANIVYLCHNCVSHIGADTYTKFLSDKWVDFFSCPIVKYNDFTTREIDSRLPTDLAALITGQKFDSFVYFGINSRQNFIEYVPSSVLPNDIRGNIVLRIDKFPSVENALKSNVVFSGIIFDKWVDGMSDVLSKSRRVYAILDDIKYSDVKDFITKDWALLCRDESLLPSKRCEFIDFKVQSLVLNRRGMLAEKDLSNTYCESDRRIWKDGAFYNSYAHLEKGLTFTEKFAIIDNPLFWEGQDFLRIFKHDR